MDISYIEGGEFKVVVFDATLKELYSHAATVSEHPVESGINVSDHVRPEADRLSVEVHVSNTPVISPNVDGADGAVQNFAVEGFRRVQTRGVSVSQAGQVRVAEYDTTVDRVGASVLQFAEPFDRVGAVYEVLSRLCKQGTEVTVTSGLRSWDSMQILRVGTPRDARGGQAATFTVDLVEVRFVSTETVETPEPLETRAERQQRLGAQSTTEVESEEDASLAAQLVEAATGADLIHAPRRSGDGVFTR